MFELNKQMLQKMKEAMLSEMVPAMNGPQIHFACGGCSGTCKNACTGSCKGSCMRSCTSSCKGHSR